MWVGVVVDRRQCLRRPASGGAGALMALPAGLKALPSYARGVGGAANQRPDASASWPPPACWPKPTERNEPTKSVLSSVDGNR